jgi:hypothetical protein
LFFLSIFVIDLSISFGASDRIVGERFIFIVVIWKMIYLESSKFVKVSSRSFAIISFVRPFLFCFLLNCLKTKRIKKSKSMEASDEFHMMFKGNMVMNGWNNVNGRKVNLINSKKIIENKNCMFKNWKY